MAKKKQWYAMKATETSGQKTAEIRIYSEIGFWGMTASDFMAELDAIAADASAIVVSINSPGGDVFDAFAIYNGLRRYAGKVTTRVDGVAASAASLIMMAGDDIVMPENATIMIHNVWTIAGGTAEDLRKAAEMMDKLRDGIVAAYQRSGQTEADIIAMMDATTWMTAAEALEKGFCTAIEEPVKLAASAEMTALLARHANAPEALIAQLEGDDLPLADPSMASEPPPAPASDPTPEPTPDPGGTPSEPKALMARVFAACRAANLGHLAEGVLASGGLDGEAQADARVSEAKEIAGLCLAAKLPDRAADFVMSGLTPDLARARLFDAINSGAAARISNVQRPPTNTAPSQSGPNPAAILAARRQAISATNR
jgi:ATP-dependent protease ClpP protease subunit